MSLVALLVTLLYFPSPSTSTTFSPVLAWSSHADAFTAPGVSTTGTASTNDLARLHLQQPAAKACAGTLVVFEHADNLYLNDFAKDAAFVHTRAAITAAPASFVVPGLTEPYRFGAFGDALVATAAAGGDDSHRQQQQQQHCRDMRRTKMGLAAARTYDGYGKGGLYEIMFPADIGKSEADKAIYEVVTRVGDATRKSQQRASFIVTSASTATVAAAATTSSSDGKQRARRSSNSNNNNRHARATNTGEAGSRLGNYIPLRWSQRPDSLNMYFTVPILMGIMIGVIMIFGILSGVNGLAHTQTMQIWPDPAVDKNLIVHEH